ncbi:hypothetical protein G8G22_005059 [Escherichia coli]|nr:hypothetical protein [Escherichia coli]
MASVLANVGHRCANGCTNWRDRICFVEPPSMMAVQQNAWQECHPCTPDDENERT